MPVSAIKPGSGSGLAAHRSSLSLYALYQPVAVPPFARRDIAIDPSTTILSRGGTLPLILLLAACGGGGGGGGDGPVTTAPVLCRLRREKSPRPRDLGRPASMFRAASMTRPLSALGSMSM